VVAPRSTREWLSGPGATLRSTSAKWITAQVVFGLLHDVTGGWTAPLAVVLAVIVAQTVVGAFAGRPGHV
jgi:hypothetical protein